MTYPNDPSSGPPQGQQPSSGAPYQQQPPSSGAPYNAPPPPGYGQQQPPGYGQPDAYAPYGQQQPQYYQQPRGTNIMAILSLVFAFVFAPVGIVLGHVAKRQIARTGEEGSGLATAGLIVSYVITGFYVLACIGAIIAAIASSSTTT
jgi:hypothetical protein